MKWMEVSKDLPIEVKTGQVLIYDYEGTPVHLKIMRQSRGKIWAKYTHLYTEDEVKKEVTVTERDNAVRTPKN